MRARRHCPTKTTEFAYDAYGNVTAKTETGAQAGTRKTTTDFKPNSADYIVDRPARQQSYEFDAKAPAADQWRRKAATEYVYDTNSAWDTPPGAKGELRRSRAFDDRADRYVETTLDYDEHGNQIKATSPTGVVAQIFYDRQRALLPVKHCVTLQMSSVLSPAKHITRCAAARRTRFRMTTAAARC